MCDHVDFTMQPENLPNNLNSICLGRYPCWKGDMSTCAGVLRSATHFLRRSANRCTRSSTRKMLSPTRPPSGCRVRAHSYIHYNMYAAIQAACQAAENPAGICMAMACNRVCSAPRYLWRHQVLVRSTAPRFAAQRCRHVSSWPCPAVRNMAQGGKSGSQIRPCRRGKQSAFSQSGLIPESAAVLQRCMARSWRPVCPWQCLPDVHPPLCLMSEAQP